MFHSLLCMVPGTLLQVILPMNSPLPKVLNQLFAIMFATEYSSEAPVSPTLQSNANTHTEQGVAPLGRAPLCFSGDLKERVTTTVTAQCQGEQSGLQMIT